METNPEPNEKSNPVEERDNGESGGTQQPGTGKPPEEDQDRD